ncbi:hypothetical protein [Nesterenkonia haasae]|uniref:hypothetical protein n=1 Tax=Nesterenkonia haasae TaxID=2587813 RepID=UPI001F1855D8|nr:hypothetical protein [Nesterenkonia haasae]
MTDATPKPQPFATWIPTRGVWETSQPDLFRQWAPYAEAWPTSGNLHDGSAHPFLASGCLTTASVCSSSPTALFRTPLASDYSRGGESLEQVKSRRGTIAPSHQIIDLTIHGPHGSPKNSGESETLWAPIEDIFLARDATPEPSPDGNTSPDDPRPHQRS